MDPIEEYCLNVTRREFFSKLAVGAGSIALGDLLTREGLASSDPLRAGSLGAPHIAPKAKRVIYLFQNGGPSQLDIFDYKPGLANKFNEDLPDSVRKGQRVTGMTANQARFPVAPSIFEFSKYKNNQDGLWVSELYPHTASMAHEMCVMYGMNTEAINHVPGITFLQTGHQQPGRPAMGSWMSYGLGRANDNLPSYVVMISQGYGNMQAISSDLWSSGFLPSEHQGINFRGAGDPVLFLSDPKGINRHDRRRMLDAIADLNQEEYHRTRDEEIMARVAQYEMAYRMQVSVPELTDITNEDEATLSLYGPDVHTPGTYAYNCLMARRMAERGVRFIQLYNRGWDQHRKLPSEIRKQCQASDQPQAGLLKDLKRRGMLDETLVVWGGEFGRGVYSQGALTQSDYGRDHHPKCFTMWMAGGGVKPGITYGKTDDYSYNIVEGGIHVHDLHATMFHLLGINHEKLTYRYQGRDFRLTDVHGHIVKDILV
ncbi:MAG: DUF1501 domain-containing protein [Verrucomicrobiota bacterium]